MKRYILIADVNGAGKSTLYYTMDSLKNMPRVNTDEIVRTFGDWKNPSDVIKAGKTAVRRVKEYFAKGVSFNQETTLCENSILRNIEKAKKLGYFVELHYVGIDSAETAKERIAYRVRQGGHGIPDADVERRYVESLAKLKSIVNICDLAVLYDNTDMFRQFAVLEKGERKYWSDLIPGWYSGE